MRKTQAVMALFLGAVSMAEAETIETSAGPMAIERMADGFVEPWGLDFLGEGRFIVTERDGRLTVITPEARIDVTGLPSFYAQGQGGLLDVMVPADFANSRRIWLTLAAPVEEGGATAAGYGRLSQDMAALEDFTLTYLGDVRASGKHFGARLVEARDGTLFLTTGDRGTGPRGQEAQDPQLSHGKIIHLDRDGKALQPNAGWGDGVYSLGHRNVQGAALTAEGDLLTVEHGARGGDEVNLVEKGKNYGWPVITYGRNYTFLSIGEGTHKAGMEQPLHYWDPSIAPSGLMIYSGDLVPDWKGDLFTGSLNSDFLSRLDPDQKAETGWAEERIAGESTGRLRDVVEGPDGAIWFLSVSDGAVYRMAPLEP